MKNMTLGLILGIAAVSLTVPHQAGAVPTLRLDDGVTTHTITLADGAITDANAAPGTVTYIGSIGSWSVNVTTGIVLSEGGPYMDLSSINVSSTASNATTLNIYFSETGFTADNGYWEAAIGGTARNTVQYRTYLDASNTLFGTGTALTNSGLLGPGAFASTQTSNTMVSGPYSLTQYVSITHGTGTRSSSFNATVSRVPEPSALLLLGFGFLGLALWRRKEVRA